MPSDLNTKADEGAIAPTDLPNQLEFDFSTSEAVKEQSTTMRPTASHFLKLISTECTDPPRAEMTMKSMMKQLLRRNRSILTRNFLEKLMRKGIGTNKAENYVRSLA